MDIKVVGLASDHAGYPLKEFIKKYLVERGIVYRDFGTNSEASCDYSDFGHALGEAIESGVVYPGIAVCGSLISSASTTMQTSSFSPADSSTKPRVLPASTSSSLRNSKADATKRESTRSRCIDRP